MGKIYKLSHNDYWVEKQVTDAEYYGCDIVEADMIVLDDDIYLSHSWRPVKSLCYGTLSGYVEKVKKTNMSILIEWKTSNPRLNEILLDIMQNNPLVRFYLTARTTNCAINKRVSMLKFYNEFQNKLNIELWDKFSALNEIESVDLFHFSLNHF